MNPWICTLLVAVLQERREGFPATDRSAGGFDSDRRRHIPEVEAARAGLLLFGGREPEAVGPAAGVARPHSGRRHRQPGQRAWKSCLP